MKVKSTCFLLVSLFSIAAFAGQDRGGGDLCEDRIKVVRDDISKWIKDGGAKNLKLPSSVSIGQYEDEMQNQISKAKIRCVGKGDAGYPVAVDGISKVCRFDISKYKKESLITCDSDKFQKINEDDQYILVHHEYAGLSQIEVPNGSDSDYSISNQISGYLVSKVVKKLSVISPSSPADIDDLRYLSIASLPRGTVIEFPLDVFVAPGATKIMLERIRVNPDSQFPNFLECSFMIGSSADARLFRGNFKIVLTETPIKPEANSGVFVSFYRSTQTLNGKSMDKILSPLKCHHDSYSPLLSEFRTLVGKLGGKITIPEPIVIE